MTAVELRPLRAATYQPHSLHSEERTWQQTNCYVDFWIEVLHGLGFDPMPALAFTLALDFEGDQYTFFKFSHADLVSLYGIDVQELNVWKPLTEHAVEQVALGRVFIPEVDSFWLPDTAGVSYQIDHTKSSIAIQHIDVEQRRLGYFHNASYHELEGDDFDAVLRRNEGQNAPGILPPYTEIAKIDRATHLDERTLAERAVRLTADYVARRPSRNPIAQHWARFPKDLEWLRGSGNPALFHQYAFATFRQVGACFDVASSYVSWLGAHGETGLDSAAASFDAIAKSAKAIQFKLARAVTLKREVDFTESFESMIGAWDTAMTALVARYGR